MIWPASTPSRKELPAVESSSKDEILADDSNKNDKILSVVSMQRGNSLMAVITWRGLYIFHCKPFCAVLAFVRTVDSISKYGENESVVVQSHGKYLALSTVSGNILMCQLHESGVEVCMFFNEHGQSMNSHPGPGERTGVRQLNLKVKQVVKMRAQVAQLIAFDKHLLVVTKDPQGLQFIEWSNTSNPKPMSMSMADMEWLPDTEMVVSVAASGKSSLAFVTHSGRVYWVMLRKDLTVTGRILHEADQQSGFDDTAVVCAINGNFNTIVVGCTRGRMHLYNIMDNGDKVKIRSIDAPPSTGRTQKMAWARDGHSLFVGYEHGWAMYSIYGMPTASSFLAKRGQKLADGWLDGIRDAAWSFYGDTVYMIPNNGEFWAMPMLKWSASTDLSTSNLQRPSLFTDDQVMLYRGYAQDDSRAIDRDALHWAYHDIPNVYITQNWPVKHASSNIDGSYLALAGPTGMLHFSSVSTKWKLFAKDEADEGFSVDCMVWYETFIIIAVKDTYTGEHEIRVFDRLTELDDSNMVCSLVSQCAIVHMFLTGSLLIVHCSDDSLTFFRLKADGKDKLTLFEVHQIILPHGLFQGAARVRCFSWLGDPKGSFDNGRLLYLVNGTLMLLTPITENGATESHGHHHHSVTYDKTILHEHIEYYRLVGTDNYHELWAFDGKDMIVWLNGFEHGETETKDTCIIPVESYPLATLPDKGLIVGIEAETVLPYESTFTYFKTLTTTKPFVPHIMESYLKLGDETSAFNLAKQCLPLKYFDHLMELLIYQIILKEEETSAETLKLAFELLKKFPQKLNVIAQAARKIEIRHWPMLFEAAGETPEKLFKDCIETHNLTAASGYLLISHSLDGDKSQMDITYDAQTLFKMAYQKSEWELCRNLARFLTQIDETGETLKKVLDSAGIEY